MVLMVLICCTFESLRLLGYRDRYLIITDNRLYARGSAVSSPPVTVKLFSFFSMASREKDKQLLLSAKLESKDEVVMMFSSSGSEFFYLDIEVEDVTDDGERSYYSVSLYVENEKVTKSKKSKPQLSVVKWEWQANHKM